MAIETIIIPKPASPSREAFTPHGLNAQRPTPKPYAQKKKPAKKKTIYTDRRPGMPD